MDEFKRGILTELINQIRAESEARILFSKDLEEKYFNLENEVKLMKNESENSHGKFTGKGHSTDS